MMLKKLSPRWRYLYLFAGLFIGLGMGPLHAQESEESGDASNEDEDIAELSPFEVSVEGDRGYYATNTISGSRISVALQDMPMPIEVITSEFIEDTGALDLRESLRYSAGVILDSQNDAGANLEDVPGGVHNGSGATANISNTVIKLRGFVTDSSLRKGFRRQHGSDSINIDRVEVVRGPAALLYGIGNFGGIVNYLPKRPLGVEQTTFTAMVAQDNFYRATIDNTAPLGENFGYRVTGAVETGDHWTDWQSHDKWFISPVLEWTPFEKTKVTLDLELGNTKTNGIGFQRLRARGNLSLDNAIGQQDRLQKSGFVDFDGIDERTFRLSGPDTFVDTDASNMLIEWNQNIIRGVDLLVGYNYAKADNYFRDVSNPAYVQGVGPANLRNTIEVLPFETLNGQPIFDAELGAGGSDRVILDDTILNYGWSDNIVNRERKEFRAEITAQKSFFQDSSWLNMNHLLLVGYSHLEAERFTAQYASGAGALTSRLYKDPLDFSPIRFGQGIQDDGTPDGVSGFDPLLQIGQAENTAMNEGLYAVWQGRFWNERITAIAGVRDDTNDQDIVDFTFADGQQTSRTEQPSEEQSQTTNQYGLSVEVLPGVTVFGLMSEGLEPNFDGFRDGNGDPIAATLAESKEAGLKLNLFDGKVAMTSSIYEINVTGTSTLPAWWTPAPAKGRYDPTQPTIYNLSGGVIGDFNPAFVANEDLWNQALANGDAFFENGVPYVTVLDANGNDTQFGAAFMDAMYDWPRNGNGWPGWMFAGNDEPTNGTANNAAQDWGAPSAGTFDARLVSEEQSTGYEIQFLLSPLDNWQILLNYAHTEREIISQGTFPRYPYPQDRWAIWYFPDGNWGLQGVPLNEAYGDPSDTSTWTGGPASTNGESLDDTPEHDFGFWTAYNFRSGSLEGLTLGFGGDYQSKRAYLTGFTVGGNAITDENGNRITLFTDDKLILNAMAKYDFELFDDNPSNVQINIDNLTNDKDLYGYVYETGLRWRVFFGTTF